MEVNNNHSRRRTTRRRKQNENKIKNTIDSIKERMFNLIEKFKRDDETSEGHTYNRRRERKNNEEEDNNETSHNDTENLEDEELDDDVEIRSLWQSKWMRAFLIVGTAFVLALIAYTTILYGGKLFVDEDKLLISPPTTIETTDGEIIWFIYDEYRLPVELKQIPEHVQNAFIAIEDRRFYTHTGVDLRSILRAVYRDILARDKVEGASTITQQLAKNVFLTHDKTWLRKIKEAMIALHLEREYSKEQILEMYLNVIYFGQGQYGIEAAANKYFRKSVEELTLEEGALLAGMIKAPNSYSPIDHPEKALKRRNVVLQAMYDAGYITQEQLEKAKQKDLALNVTTRKINPAYHTIADLAIKEAERVYGLSLDELKTKRYRIVTSMDEEIQQIVYDEFQYDGYFPGNKKETVEGAFVMLDNKTGAIVAAMGGRHYERGNLNRVLEKRQPGSTMKPIAVYAPALELGEFTPFSMLPDRREEIDGHEVRNHDDRYDGQVSLYDALVRSKNTTATWLLNEIGIKNAKKYLEKMDIHIEDKGLSIALGGLKEGISPLQMAEAYRTFNHNGEKVDAHVIVEIYNHKDQIVAKRDVKPQKVFSDQVAWTMTEMLKDVVKKGTARAGYYPYELAGKTGTTQHVSVEGEVKDAWFVGYTPEFVTALWMGYDVSNEEQFLTGGSSYPTELTKKILTEISKRRDVATAFAKPEHVQALSEPIELPKINDLVAYYTFGGLKILKGKLEWSIPKDLRIIYYIYEQHGDEVTKIGEVVGDDEFIIDDFMLFKRRSYYVVPYNPLTGETGPKSNIVDLP